jgi:glycine/D-amino acid oxidase-like deaminating enzyme
MTPDDMFLVDRHPTQRNLFVAGGFSGAGFKYGLTIGKIVAQLVNGIEEPKIHGFNGEQPFKQMDLFSLSRHIQKQNLH